MATKQFYATGDFRYGTRMLRAGDPVEMDAPSAKLFNALGKITERKPRTPNQVRESVGLPPIPKAAPKRRRKAKK